jgi:hypothetical protein
VSSINDGLISVYGMDELSGTLVGDSVGSNDATATGATVDAVNQALGAACRNFDGIDDRIVIPFSTDFNFGTGDFSLAFLVNPTAYPAGVARIFRRVGTAGTFLVTLRSTQNITFGTGTVSITTTLTTPLAQYSLLICERVSGVLKVTINDVEDAATVASTDNVDGIDDLYLGSQPDLTNEYNGKMDQVVFKNGTWTSGEKTQLYNGGAFLQLPADVGGVKKVAGMFGLGRLGLRF